MIDWEKYFEMGAMLIDVPLTTVELSQVVAFGSRIQ